LQHYTQPEILKSRMHDVINKANVHILELSE